MGNLDLLHLSVQTSSVDTVGCQTETRMKVKVKCEKRVIANQIPWCIYIYIYRIKIPRNSSIFATDKLEKLLEANIMKEEIKN